MKLTMLAVPLALIATVVSLRVCHSAGEDLASRRKTFGNCNVYRQEAKQASTWTLNVGPVKVSHETKEVKPSDELTKLGLAAYTLCRQYETDPTLTDDQFSSRMADLTAKKAEVLKAVSHQLELHETLGMKPTVKVEKNKEKR
jgi:hypothetical protein